MCLSIYESPAVFEGGLELPSGCDWILYDSPLDIAIENGGRVPSSIRVRSQAFCGILRTCGHPACGAQGVPLRATALSWSRILRITATTATFPGFPR